MNILEYKWVFFFLLSLFCLPHAFSLPSALRQFIIALNLSIFPRSVFAFLSRSSAAEGELTNVLWRKHNSELVYRETFMSEHRGWWASYRPMLSTISFHVDCVSLISVPPASKRELLTAPLAALFDMNVH